MQFLSLYLSLILLRVCIIEAIQCSIENQDRVDCYPETIPAVKEHCEQRGCCYNSNPNVNDNVPWCFFPTDYKAYKLSDYKTTPHGFQGDLTLTSGASHHFVDEIQQLKLLVYLETETRLHFKIVDANKPRYEVPIQTPALQKAAENTAYKVDVQNNRFGLIVTRKDTGVVILNTTIAPLIYSDQFLQMSSALPTNDIYGLGERHGGALVSTNWNRLLFWARDQRPQENENLYGDHAFYMGIENDGKAHGVFLLNSNAKEIELQPSPALTWRTIGGILDFYVFLGPTPEEVVQQYTQVIGRTFMPPYWSLGFHLCRWGYGSSNNTWDIVKRMREAKIPQDVQWNDIDYMSKRLDFTYDKTTFDTLPQMVEDLHENGQHYIMIIDPGISNKQPTGTYPAYKQGIELDVFIKDPRTNAPISGEVWPGSTVYPDYTHPNINSYWKNQLSGYEDKINFDGVWVDMNEPSNFVTGSTTGCPNNQYEDPPYVPHVTGGKLQSRTLCSSSKHYNETIHYNVHSLTGLLEMKATSEVMASIRKKRPFVISRSTFPSAGMYGGHWSGDITSTWPDLRQSIASVINFNMFGIPMVGADICGFSGSTNEELCIRWMQLGAFYPFSRNHNMKLTRGQAPVDFSTPVQVPMRNALLKRYLFLPYLYTLFYSSHINGTTVARGLMIEFPEDHTARKIDEQFMWGSGLLISPCLYVSSSRVNAYFPRGLWYDCTTENFGNKINSQGQYETLSAPLNGSIPLHIRGGNIIPAQYPELNTVKSRKQPFILFVAPDNTGKACGQLYWDDGETLLGDGSIKHVAIDFVLLDNTLSSYASNFNYTESMMVSDISIFGISTKPKSVTFNKKEIVKTEIVNGNTLRVEVSADLKENFELKWVL
uniref:LOW QUALITY PROTEIN: lysosomal alpha-glucosidase-like n=1 Tax=Ciona intestinalis TaxID=7719 RepID=UPI00052140A4|nr:LOW QUALITY PROTEIN: lysosomal alpha-glucosidase-like [Ciona intestinalis]|eukprot:XP_026693555.1 LOW QUALITY PROTEIN: lysosomal alpha-glucosidase-like [Ciona intestinalis]